ncbi:bifunctional 5,10-methylenetetrahydrofolate dehydrogenase/5,10-methenyltetrahydrofolate cyclohydrolase [Alicyclobacillus fastidiosus]|uniref:Bifunctional protein FolD n=1 Tax=Alicyclobacillus fastidiosus TaxID=392011 RepID=A0ABV5AFU9_9BACL|nr:tetrahydrofolate dehydrogenase/cyclohydrolase catalytic domain-containing protein [Alicyclobacillus fastidiosus]WEH11720.1 tetrahydrofolate dehydrogenase/cyclohydrolase catalytic domain-containing protein [Alicyclobacillus fastidiosus]
MARILDGKAIAAAVKQDLAMEIAQLRECGVQPKLVVVLVGDDAASASYVRSKERLARELGMEAEVIRLAADVSEVELLRQIELQNADDAVDALLVQLPLPDHIDTDRVLAAVDPNKDVDGFHPQNIGRYAMGSPLVWPCTTAGILEILVRSSVPLAGQTAVVVGRSRIVGWPTAQLLLAHNATVVQCHSRTKDLTEFTRQADILVVAAGQAGLIGVDDVREGAVVIDVGINRVDGRLVGDVDFDSVVAKAGAITPVPGGVGPLTVAMLMKNTVRLARLRRLTKGDER